MIIMEYIILPCDIIIPGWFVYNVIFSEDYDVGWRGYRALDHSVDWLL